MLDTIIFVGIIALGIILDYIIPYGITRWLGAYGAVAMITLVCIDIIGTIRSEVVLIATYGLNSGDILSIVIKVVCYVVWFLGIVHALHRREEL